MAQALNPAGGWTVHKSFHTGAGPYLSYKIAAALRKYNPDYTPAQIDHAKWVVQRNTASIALSEDYPAPKDLQGPAIDWNAMPAVIERLLQMLLRPEDRRDTVELNSNELVVVINAHSAWPVFDMRTTVDEVTRQMQGKWNYWPARVLGGFDIQRSGGHRGVSLTVLNVQNLDLNPGGPSGGMVACLDDHTVEEPRWERIMVRKMFRGRDSAGEFVHPELLDWVTPQGGYYRIARAVLGENEDDVSSSGQAKGGWNLESVTYGVRRLVDKPEEKTPEPEPVGGKEEEAEVEMFKTVEELPDRYRHRLHHNDEDDRPPIQHPTFRHEGEDEPFIDLVGRQARRFATPDSGIGDDPGPAETKKLPISSSTPPPKVHITYPQEEDEDYEII